MADKNKASGARIAFTLPISCQICLGKVKQPMVCPNQHVFCGTCLDVWMERNQQCPSCRVNITAENPCKKVLGGLNQSEDYDENFKSKELRRARTELLFREYEDEIDKLQMEIDALKHENDVLQEQMQGCSPKPAEEKGREDEEKDPHVNMLMMLTKKLQDATSLYEKVKKDLKSLKKENHDLKEENINISRENQRLCLELANRSPRKFGRLTVATLESKVEQYEKEISQLQKCLERSDAYIEDLEKELEEYRKKMRMFMACSTCKEAFSHFERNVSEGATTNKKDASNHSLEMFKSNTGQQQMGNSRSVMLNGKGKGIGKTTVKPGQDESKSVPSLSPKSPSISLENFYGRKSKLPASKVDSQFIKPMDFIPKAKTTQDTSSFELEMPSPMTPSTSLSKLSLKTDGSPPDEEAPLTSVTDAAEGNNHAKALAATSLGSCKKRLKFDDNKSRDFLPLASSSTLQQAKNNLQVTFNDGPDKRNTGNAAYNKSLFPGTGLSVGNQSGLTKKKSETLKLIEMPTSSSASSSTSTDEDLDPNMSVDIADCMKILDEAEKKVEQNKQEVSAVNMAAWNVGNAKDVPTSSIASSNPASGRAAGDVPGSAMLGSVSKAISATVFQPSSTAVPSFQYIPPAVYPGSCSQPAGFLPVTASSGNLDLERTLKFHGPCDQYSVAMHGVASHQVQSSAVNNNYPPRPASTSTMERMMHETSNMDSVTRSTSVPLPLSCAPISVTHHAQMSPIPENSNSANANALYPIQSTGRPGLPAAKLQQSKQILPSFSSFANMGNGFGGLSSSSLSQPISSASNFQIPGLQNSLSKQVGMSQPGSLVQPSTVSQPGMYNELHSTSQSSGFTQLADQYLQSKGLGNLNWKSQ